MSSSDVEMVDLSHSKSEPEGLQRVRVVADIAAACKRGPERVTVKGKQYMWKQHEDNQRALQSLPSSCSSAECERVFSGTKKLITPERNRLAEEIIEASEYLKNWWDRGLIQQLEEEEAI
jgi:hypothetical protein